MPFSSSFQSIQNAYVSDADVAIAGMLSGSWSYMYGKLISRVLRSAATKQVLAPVTLTKGANAGTITVTLGGVSPVTGATFSIATAYSASGGDTDVIATAAIATSINANETLNDFLRASAAAGVLTITLNSPYINPVTTFTVAATGSGNSWSTASITDASTTNVGKYGYAAGFYSGDADKFCRPITTASGLTLGGVFAIAGNHEQPYLPTSLTELSYALGQSATLAPFGSGVEIWVPVAAAVTELTVPGIVNATGQFTANGSGTAATGSQYLTTQATVGGLAKVRL